MRLILLSLVMLSSVLLFAIVAPASVDDDRGHPGVHCANCHVAWAPDAHTMTPPDLDACRACHTENSLGLSHAVGGGVIDPQTGNEMTCISSCHSEHNIQGAKLIQATQKLALCQCCHPEKF